MDCSTLIAEWDEVQGRRPEFREALQFWGSVLGGWARWKEASPAPLRWSAEECRQRWEREVPLLDESDLEIPAGPVEDLIGPVMERLCADGPDTAAAFQRFAEAWDAGEIGPAILLPRGGDSAARLAERFAIATHLGGFLGVAGLRPALEGYFQHVRSVPEGLWARGSCPWCGGAPSYGDLVEDGRRRLSCPLCGGTWIAARLKCPFCDSWESRDFVRLLAEGA